MNGGVKMRIHISFDDVWRCLHDISVHPYRTPFENAFLSDLRTLHERYSACFTLYCFNRFTGEPAYDIASLPARYAADLSACGDWLRFGFHGQDDRSNYGSGLNGTSTGGVPTGDCPEAITASYRRFAQAVARAGCAIDPVVRLGFFGGTAENIRALRRCGVTGLLAADDTRVSYHLTDGQNAILLRDGRITVEGLPILRSHTRLERVADAHAFAASLDGPNAVLFTHEQHYDDIVRSRLVVCLERLYK